MSTPDHVFLQTGLPLDEAGRRIADVLGMELYSDPSGDFALGAQGFAGLAGLTRADLTPNVYSGSHLYADEAAAYDGADAVLRFQRPDKDLIAQQSAARDAMRLLVERCGWRAVLVHNVSTLLATWDPVSGWREYPPGTSPDIEDQDAWAISP